jgi:hypothetical protein
VIVIAGGQVAAAVGFGLFAVLSIIRLRAETLSNRDIAYFFAAIVLGLVCAIDLGGIQANALLAALVVAAPAAIDHPRLLAEQERLTVTVDVAEADPAALRAELEARLHVPVISWRSARWTTSARPPGCRSAWPSVPARVPRPAGRPPVSRVLELLQPIGLEELDSQAALQRRCERKYVLTQVQLDGLLTALAGSHRALELGGVRRFRYRTTYYDTPDLLTLRAHVQNRRRRFKLRKRRYEDAGRSVVEVKLKGPRGETLKVAGPGGPDDALDAAEAAFLVAQVHLAYGHVLEPVLLAPTLTVTCSRSTLVASGPAERVTVDGELALGDAARLAPGLAVVESKTAGAPGRATGSCTSSARGPSPAARSTASAWRSPVPTCARRRSAPTGASSSGWTRTPRRARRRERAARARAAAALGRLTAG